MAGNQSNGGKSGGKMSPANLGPDSSYFAPRSKYQKKKPKRKRPNDAVKMHYEYSPEIKIP